VTVRFNLRPMSGCRASSLAKFRRALAAEHVGSTNGCCPIIAQRLIFLAIKISRISGRACIFSIFLQRTGSEARSRDDSTLGAAGLRTDISSNDGNSVGLAN
jgi:hypothetical protein